MEWWKQRETWLVGMLIAVVVFTYPWLRARILPTVPADLLQPPGWSGTPVETSRALTDVISPVVGSSVTAAGKRSSPRPASRSASKVACATADSNSTSIISFVR